MNGLSLHINISNVGGESAIHLPDVTGVNFWNNAVELSDNDWIKDDLSKPQHYPKRE